MAQLSINADKPADYHLGLGARLAPLRERGVLIVASGNVVHNLGGMSRDLPDDGYDWARRFDEAAKELMQTDPTQPAALDAHRDYRHAVPTPDHFLPLLYLAGVAAAAEDTAEPSSTGGRSAPATEVLVDGYAYGSLSMTAYTLGASCPAGASGGTAPALPEGTPPDGSNM